jgi:prepilin-type N-terminal cleavage/methylation domain-containing protein
MKSPRIQGFSLPEVIVYIAILTIISLALAQTVIVANKSFQLARAERTIDASTLAAYDRLSREIRNATSVDTADSVLNASPGTLALYVGTGSSQITRKFYLGNGVIKVSDNGVFQGDLTSDEATTTSLIFRILTATSTMAVRVEMVMAAQATSSIASDKFYDTFVVRNTYEQ